MARLAIVLLAAALLSLAGVALAAPVQQLLPRLDLPPQDPQLYAVDPQPLTVEQCGQCHPSHFFDLKRQGGRHQFDCRECHTTFHAYNPRKDNYAVIMPSCTECHAVIHGEMHRQCLDCHTNPHAATQPPALAGVINACSDCHTDQNKQLERQPSRHTELSCDNCHHTEHGLIPSCAECHQPHFASQAFTGCVTCHPAHQPLIIPLNAGIELRTCSGCHASVYAKWSNTASRHGQVNCAECHTEHKTIPDCKTCHAILPAHSKTMLDKFPRCLDCHLDVHDLPVKK